MVFKKKLIIKLLLTTIIALEKAAHAKKEKKIF